MSELITTPTTPRRVGTRQRLLVRRNLPVTARRLWPLLVMMAVAVASLLICDAVIAGGVTRYAETIRSQSALNVVQVTTTAAGASREIDGQSLRSFERLDGVVGVDGWTQVDLSLSDPAAWPGGQNPGALWATPFIASMAPRIVAGSVPGEGLGPSDVVIPQDAASGSLSHLLGRTVTFEYTRMTSPGHGEPARTALRVVALFDNTTPGQDGPQPAYVAPSVVDRLAAARQSSSATSAGIHYDRAFVRVADPARVPDIQRQVSDAGYGVFSIADQIQSLGGLFRVLAIVGWFIGALLLLFCLGVGTSVGSSWARQRMREVGLLRAVGWSRGDISRAFLAEIVLVGGAAGVVGAIGGILASLVATTVVAGLDLELLPVAAWTAPSPLWVVVGALGVPFFLALGAFRSVLAVSRVEADVALRDL